MAKRRMFSTEITNSDAFLDMPLSAQALYFHWNLAADDDGLVNNAKAIRRLVGASADDAKLLVAKKFIIPFDSGVIAIKHWKINNSIRADRRRATNYGDEMLLLGERENGAYYLLDGPCQPDDNQVATNCQPNDRVGKERLGKERLGKEREEESVRARRGDQQAQNPPRHRHGESSNVLLTDDELEKLKGRFPNDWQSRIEALSLYMDSTGKRYKSHYRTLLNWDRMERERRKEGAPDAGKYAMYDR